MAVSAVDTDIQESRRRCLCSLYRRPLPESRKPLRRDLIALPSLSDGSWTHNRCLYNLPKKSTEQRFPWPGTPVCAQFRSLFARRPVPSRKQPHFRPVLPPDTHQHHRQVPPQCGIQARRRQVRRVLWATVLLALLSALPLHAQQVSPVNSDLLAVTSIAAPGSLTAGPAIESAPPLSQTNSSSCQIT